MFRPETLFIVCNLAALAGWALLAASVLAPSLRRVAQLVAGVGLPAIIAAIYVGALAAAFGSGAQGGFGSLSDLRALFANDHALLAGWVHYLAFDLVVGALIARAAAASGMRAILVLPSLALTFLFGPAGLLLFLALRFAGGARPMETLS
ncbi:abscisic acid-deficient protein Aba4 family protein [Methylopila turkensis]|uniref:DUF4281 domain-containing protein n=1 Tax=Methylopila turkensis TaxID=1437816 RepID=A0A9W6N7H7_9HYPH|nr:abscisic acid-deficient protein Aba4 family protein [Methylopila turkensis]GLK80427.1 hypothetical protein GCM10008174_21680 [Methylopila turkensis]